MVDKRKPIMNYPQVVSIGEPLVEFITPTMGTSLLEATHLKKCPAGGAAIFAVAVAKLGVSCGLVGNLGDEGFGDYLKTVLESEGVETSQLRKEKHFQTGLAFTSYDRFGQRKYIYYRKNSAGTRFSKKHINSRYLSSTSVLHFPGTTLTASNSAKEAVSKAVKVAAANGAAISFDPNVRTEIMSISKIRSIYNEFWPVCDLATPSKEEITMLTRCDSLEKATQQLLRKGVKIVAVTLGSEGCLIATKDETFSLPAFKVKAVDPTGAGDTFNAAFVVGLVEKAALRDIARFANAAAAITVQKVGHIGYALPTRRQVDRLKRIPNS